MIVKPFLREQALAFRLEQQHLARRLPPGALLAAVTACGIRNSPPGSAEMALHARLADFNLSQLQNALADRELLEIWSMRLSPFFLQPAAAAIFTTGLLPQNDAWLRVYLQTALSVLDGAGISATEALEVTAAAALEALDGRRLPKGELSTEISRRVPDKMLFWCVGCGASHINETLFRLSVQKAQICFESRTGAALLFVRSDQWLKTPLPQLDPEHAQSEVLRRYLHLYGPSNPQHYSIWAGLTLAQARLTWQILISELAELRFEGKPAWLLQSDQPVFEAARLPVGIRLLPPYDPYLLLSDRATLVADKKRHSQVWRAIGNPGVVLAGGEVAGVWRPQKKGQRLLLTIEPFQVLPPEIRASIEAEAFGLAHLRGCTIVEVKFED